MNATETISNKKPFGFYVCAITFALERCAYYSAKLLITFFVAAAIMNGGLGLGDVEGALMQSNLVAFTYIAPVFGGIIADRWLSPKLCLILGLWLMAAGYAVGFVTNSKMLLWVMIILVSLGTGLFKGILSSTVGRLFNNPDELDSAFSLQYTFVNIGAFIGPTIIGITYVTMGYRASFLICAIIMVVAALWFMWGQKYLGEVGSRPFKYDVVVDESDQTHANDLEDIAPVKDITANKAATKPLTKVEKNRMWAIVIVSLLSVIFWLFWYLAYLPIYYRWEEAANWVVGAFTVPVAWFDSLNAFACIALGPIMGMLWLKLSRRPQGDMSLFAKVAIALILMGVSYLILALADVVRGTGQASLLWIAAFGILLSLAEMFFSPLGNSFVSKYAPAKYLSVMMGVWTFATFIAAKTYGYLYAFLERFNYVHGNIAIAAIAIISALIILAFQGKLNKLTQE